MREEARQAGRKPRYNGRCRTRDLGPGEGRCVRLKAPLSGKVVFDDMVKGRIAVDVSELDDMVIRRADGMPTYNMAVVVDDHSMGITHVIRGDDHVSNTPRQILIYEALGLPVPHFGHVPMILGPDRQKLSKRHGARAVIEYKQDGLLPQALVNYLVRLGWSHGDQELFTREELIAFFDGTNLNPAAAAFDPAKLEWCNAHFMRAMPLDELARLTAPFAAEAGLGDLPQERLEPLCRMFRERANNLKALAQSFRPWSCPPPSWNTRKKTPPSILQRRARPPARPGPHLCRLRTLLRRKSGGRPQRLCGRQRPQIQSRGPPLRTALMGFMGGSHLNEIWPFWGRRKPSPAWNAPWARRFRALQRCNP